MSRLCSSLLVLLLIATSASAVSMQWTFIGNPGNPCDLQPSGVCFGAVGYNYAIGTYEVTNTQYTEFLNAVAKTDTHGLYNSQMGTDFFGNGGITRGGASGSFTYTTIAGRESFPVNFVSFWDSVRFVNWLNNGQPTGSQNSATTEAGAYEITQQGISSNSIARSPGATMFLPSDAEWYKAAYYDATSTSYHTYPFADGGGAISCSAPPGATNHSANCKGAVLNAQGYVSPTNVGAYSGSPSEYGTLDQAGNIDEWNETLTVSGSARRIRGGSFGGTQDSQYGGPNYTGAEPGYQSALIGFRVAMIPEPGTGLLVIAGMLGLAGWRRVSA